MRLLFLFLFILFVTGTNAQVEGQDAQTNVADMAGGSMFRSFDSRFKGIEGTPTLYESYQPGEVTMLSGKRMSFDLVNIDIYKNELVVKRYKAESVFNRSLIKEFTIQLDDNTVTFIKSKNAEGTEVFYQVLVSGKVQLFKHTYKIIQGPTNSGAYSSGRTNSVFVEKSKVYFQKEGGEMIELKSNKDIQGQFPDQETQISQFIKTNKIKVKDEEDAVKLVEFVNTLL